ncbi:MAG: ribonuclease III [Candidatus Zixiibacteriota bacterium]|nr:MAG: ribonuclease III [candidate division Zixibacteria bacterium]
MGWWRSLKALLAPRESEPANLNGVENILNYHFQDQSLLRLALSHRSAVNASDTLTGSNERLEFLGDSVLGMIIAHQLYLDNPRMSEGDLTKTKSMLVNETTLATIGKTTGLNRYIFLSSDEERSGGRERSSIIADAVEGIIGAVYLDGGFEAARQVILRLIYANRHKITSDVAPHNYKGDLLEFVQARSGVPPRYEVVAENGPDHDKVFEVVVYVNGEPAGEGSGPSKKEAEQNAAREALRALGYSRS